MKKILIALVLLLCAGLAGCGGGGSNAITCGWYSASDGSGGYLGDQGSLQVMSPTPVEMVSAAGVVQCTNHSIGGIKLSELLHGGQVALAVPSATVDPLNVQLQRDTAQIAVIGAGMVDALFGDVTVDAYRAMVREAVATVRDAGKTPVLRGFNQFAVTPVLTPARLARAATFGAALREEAASMNVALIDVESVRFDGLADMRPDGLHSVAAYHLRIAALAAQVLDQIASGN